MGLRSMGAHYGTESRVLDQETDVQGLDLSAMNLSHAESLLPLTPCPHKRSSLGCLWVLR
jgi:hypothetical protein